MHQPGVVLDRLYTAQRVMQSAYQFHERRDEMDGYLHLESVRWSPLTLALHSAMKGLDAVIEAVATDVMKEAVFGTQTSEEPTRQDSD